MAFEVRATVEVAAPIQVVWEVLTDTACWSEWSTLVSFEGGRLGLGERIALRLHPPGGGGYAFRPTITALDPPHRLEWLGRTGLPGLFDGRHRSGLEETPGGTILTNAERYSGLLSPLMARLPQMRGAQAGFEAMNAEVRDRAEALAKAHKTV